MNETEQTLWARIYASAFDAVCRDEATTFDRATVLAKEQAGEAVASFRAALVLARDGEDFEDTPQIAAWVRRRLEIVHGFETGAYRDGESQDRATRRLGELTRQIAETGRVLRPHEKW